MEAHTSLDNKTTSGTKSMKTPNFNSFYSSSRTCPMTYSNKANFKRIKVYATHRTNRTRLNATVFIISIVSILWACYLTDKGFKKCLADGKFTTIECEKKHLG